MLKVSNICYGLRLMTLHGNHNCFSRCFKMHCLLFCGQVLHI